MSLLLFPPGIRGHPDILPALIDNIRCILFLAGKEVFHQSDENATQDQQRDNIWQCVGSNGYIGVRPQLIDV